MVHAQDQRSSPTALRAGTRTTPTAAADGCGSAKLSWHGAWAKARARSTHYLKELRRLGVCQLQTAANQHQTGCLEVCERFWPYHKQLPATPVSDQAHYVEQIRQLFLSRSCVQGTFSAADEKLAADWYRRHVPLEQMEQAYLLGCARKYVPRSRTISARSKTLPSTSAGRRISWAWMRFALIRCTC